MPDGRVAVDALHVRARRNAMWTSTSRGRIEEGLFQVAVLHVVPAAAEEMAGAAVGALRLAHVLGDVVEVDRRVGHAGARRPP